MTATVHPPHHVGHGFDWHIVRRGSRSMPWLLRSSWQRWSLVSVRERLPGRGWRANRRWVLAVVVLGAVLLGVAAAVVDHMSREERIASYWTHAAVSDGGRAQVVEVIDYDFAADERHGIIREIPGVTKDDAPFAISSPSAPDDVQLTTMSDGVRLRIGDPDSTINGIHRYRIEYPHDGLVRDEVMSWNAVGLGWEVPIQGVEIHVTAPFEFTDLVCDQGTAGSRDGCTVDQIEPGHLLVETSDLSPFEGVTVTATLGDQLAEPPAEPVPPATVAGGGANRVTRGVLVAAVALVAGLATHWVLRRLGRDRVWSDDPVTAAHGPTEPDEHDEKSMDYRQLSRLATTEFAPPKNLPPEQGGIVLDEEVRDEHKSAWLLERAVVGDITLEEPDVEAPTLVRCKKADEDGRSVLDQRVLDQMFGSRDRLRLGEYDPQFAQAWRTLEADLDAWRMHSGLWDQQAASRRSRVLFTGVVLAIFGIALTLISIVAANQLAHLWIAFLIPAAAVAGASLVLVFGAWELRRRTPEGSALWLQVESFRRFLAASEERHAVEAAKRGVLREYTAWAMSLGELDHWSDVVAAAAARPDVDFGDHRDDVYFVGYASTAGTKETAKTATSPRSKGSSGGGGGGGGSGGGGGGGGGGSW